MGLSRSHMCQSGALVPRPLSLVANDLDAWSPPAVGFCSHTEPPRAHITPARRPCWFPATVSPDPGAKKEPERLSSISSSALNAGDSTAAHNCFPDQAGSAPETQEIPPSARPPSVLQRHLPGGQRIGVVVALEVWSSYRAGVG